VNELNVYANLSVSERICTVGPGWNVRICRIGRAPSQVHPAIAAAYLQGDVEPDARASTTDRTALS